MTGSITKRITTALAAAILLAAAPVLSHAVGFPINITARYGHTTTVLTSGDILVMGGMTGTGAAPSGSVEKIAISRGSVVQTMASLATARSSHTATLMSNGCVLIAGGDTGGGTATNSVVVYNPQTNTYSSPGNMTNARYNHTATLLNDGDVLVCGGQSNAGGTAVAGTGGGNTGSCERYTPTACGTGSWVAAADLQLGRYNHTAVLLKDGKVWFAGGKTPVGYTGTTERFTPGATSGVGAMASAAPMIEGRENHSATMMGDGKILVVGGYNNRETNGNLGILDTTEIYDPVANSVISAAQTIARRTMTTTVLGADGVVMSQGGLGNITTTYVFSGVDGVLKAGSNVNATYSGVNTDATVTGGTMFVDQDYILSKEVRGQIMNGEALYSTPTIHAQSMMINWTPGIATAPATGIRTSLNGYFIDARNSSADPPNNWGNFRYTDVPITNLQGKITFFPRVGVGPSGPANLTSGVLRFPVGGGGSLSSGQMSLDPFSNVQTVATIVMPNEFIGYNIQRGTLTLVNGSFTQNSSFSVTLDGGQAGIPINWPITADANGDGQALNMPLSFTGLSGTIEWAGDPGYVANSDFSVPVGANPVALSFSGKLSFTTTGANLKDMTFDVDLATVVVRKMVFTNRMYYNPAGNQWTHSPPNGASTQLLNELRYGASAALMPNNDPMIIGGASCNDMVCSSTAPASFFGNAVTYPPLDAYAILTAEKNFAAVGGNMVTARALHTSTLLPSGKILVAGGTNGPSLLKTAELLDTGGETFTATPGEMTYVRDLHTATLLPNGRVLIAGGFTTNAVSTGSTNTVEIFYPETGHFIETTPMISSRSNHTAIMMPDGRVLVAGGFGPNDVITGTAEIFVSTRNTWQAAAPITSGAGCRARALHANVQLTNGKILLIGGEDASGPMTQNALYDPATDTWNCGAGTIAPLPTALHSHSASLLFDGRVIVAGGNDGFGEVNQSFIYDPIGNVWSTINNSFYEPRFRHSATLLPNGTVMMSGGIQKFGTVPQFVETFHVNGSSWVAGIPLKSGNRVFHTMTLAGNNKLYAIGGSDGAIGASGSSLYTKADKGYFTYTPDAFSKGAPPSLRQSTITATSATPFLPGTNLRVQGNQFRGGTEATGGGAGASYASFSFPRMVLQQIDGSGGSGSQGNGGFAVDLTTQIYLNSSNFTTLNTSVTVALPATNAGLPYGWYTLRMGANDVYSDATFVQVGPAKPTTAVTGLAGTAQGISSMSWTWNQVASVDGYNVYNATTGVFIATVAPSVTPVFVETGLQPSATVAIIVAPYTLSGDGPLTSSPTTYTLSTTPISVTIASVTFSDLLLQWNVNNNAAPGTIYEVSESSDDFLTSFSTPVPTLFRLTDPQVVIDNLTPNTTYFFRVRAFNLVGIPSPFSISVSTRTRAPVSQPSVQSRTTTAIVWQWPDPGSINSFNVYNATSGVLLGNVPGSPTPSFNDTGLSTNTIRSIRVTAITNAGEGPLSPSASAYTAAAAPALASPAIPVITLSSGSFTVSWSNNGNPLGTDYLATITQLNPATSLPITTFTVATTGFNAPVFGLIPGSLYSFNVAAVNGDGISAVSVTQSTWTKPTQPGPLVVTAADPTSIAIDWAPNNNGSSTTYQVTIATDITGSTAILPYSLGFGGTNYVITGLLTSTSYTITVTASNPFGQTSLPAGTTGFTNNGGAPIGSISGLFSTLQNSQISGNIGNGRQITLRAPAHTFPTDVTVTISSFAPAGTLCPNATNIAFSITDNPALQPIGSLYLTFGFTPAELGTIPASRALLLRYDPGSNTCVPLETTLDAGLGRMTARINHFSLFQVGQVPAQTNTEFARIFPNPYYTGRDGYVTIDNLPAGARVRVFTLRGEQVMDQLANGAGLLTWSGTNGSGRAVASGVYLVMVESGSSKKILKLAVIR